MNYKTTIIDEAARANVKPEALLEEADAEQDFDNNDIEPWNLAGRLYEKWRDWKMLRDESPKGSIKGGGGGN